MLSVMRVADDALRHGVEEPDMLHALRNARRIIDQDDVDLIIGPSRTGDLLEIGVLDPDGDAVIIHAMRMRSSFNRYL
jgi:hypothetical protein